MAYVYNGKARSYTLEITQNIGGVDYTFNPPLNMIQNFPGSGGAITEEQFYRLSAADFLTRVNAYYAYLMVWNPNLVLPGDILVGPEIENPDCEGEVPIDTTLPPSSTTTTTTTTTVPPDSSTVETATQNIVLDCADFGVTFTNGFGSPSGNNIFEAWVQLENPTIENISFTVEYYAVRQDTTYPEYLTESILVSINAGNDYSFGQSAYSNESVNDDWLIVGWRIIAATHTWITTINTPYPSCGTWPETTAPEEGTCYSIWIPNASMTSGADDLYIEYRNPGGELVDVLASSLPETGESIDNVVINLCSMIFPLFQYGPVGTNIDHETVGITVYTGGSCTVDGECSSPTTTSAPTTAPTTTVGFIEHIDNANYLVDYNNFLPGSANIWGATINFTSPLNYPYTFIIEFTATRIDTPDTYTGNITVFGSVGSAVASAESTTGLAQEALEEWTVTAYNVIQINPDNGAYTFEPFPTPTTV